MAMHKASSRRVEVLSRTTGNVDQVRQVEYTCVAHTSGTFEMMIATYRRISRAFTVVRQTVTLKVALLLGTLPPT